MQSIKKLEAFLLKHADEQSFIFTVNSLAVVFPELTEANLNQLLCRANKTGMLERVCKGVYIYPRVKYDPSSVLFCVAKALRFPEYMYVSLESVLSAMSVISQQMISYLTIITSGRSGIIDCSRFGKIEFVHSDIDVVSQKMLNFDMQTGMFWASKELALQDMRRHRRKLLSMVEDL